MAGGGRVLFVGTKRQAQEPIAEAAKKLGAVLHQFALARRHAHQLEDHLQFDQAPAHSLMKCSRQGALGLTKRELLDLTRERDKLDQALGGIKDMGGTPDIMFVIDTNKEAIAIKEANRLGIPVVAILDTNCDPDGVTYPIPGNDDAGRAVSALLRSRSAVPPSKASRRAPRLAGARYRRGRGTASGSSPRHDAEQAAAAPAAP